MIGRKPCVYQTIHGCRPKMKNSTDENVRVCIRFRPVNTRERRGGGDGGDSISKAKGDTYGGVNQRGGESCWKCDQNSVKALFPVTRSERARQSLSDRYGESAGPSRSTSPADTNSADFHFDRVFGEQESTDAVYVEMVQELVESSVEGKHSVAFAFGQTSTGKTYTMQGTSENPGAIPRAVHDVFAYIDERPEREFLLRASYMEVYNESINDLFEPSSMNLKIFEDPKLGPRVQGLEEKIVVTPEQVFALISAGEAHRHVGCTDYNKQSSRSHTIFRLVIESKERETNTARAGRKSARVATLNLVDLAGSEAAQSIQSRSRRHEGSSINKSLLTLTSIIFKLSERGQKKKGIVPAHIPYRDSKLTRILQKSLDGNSRIAIVCTVTPWCGAKDETLNTLRFASRAKRVRRTIKVNEVMDESALLLKYRQEIDELRQKLAIAEESLSQKKSTTPGISVEEFGTNFITAAEAEHSRMRQNISKLIGDVERLIVTSKTAIATTPKRSKPQKEDPPPERGNTPYFRRLSKFDSQLDGIESHAYAHVGGVDHVEHDQLDKDSSFPTGVKDDSSLIDEDIPKKLDTRDRSISRESSTGSQPGVSIITSELRTIKEQLSGLLTESSATLSPPPSPPLGPLPSPLTPPRDPTFGMNQQDYISFLENRVQELERQVQKHDVQNSVSEADRSFLESLLADRDHTIQEWSAAITDIDEKQKALEAENQQLRIQLQQYTNL